MKLVFKQRGLCEYVMVPLDTSWRTAYAQTTKRAKRHWVASKLAMILPFDDTEKQFLPTFDTPSFRSQSKSDNLRKKKPVCIVGLDSDQE